MSLPIDPSLFLTPLALGTLIVAFFQIRQNQIDLKKRQREIDQKIYETLILREIGERIGYELNIARILDTIVDSLNRLLSFSVVSYLLVNEDKNQLNLKQHLEESVNKDFLRTMRSHMLQSLKELSAKNFSDSDIVEMITGTIVSEDMKQNISSLWITPISINSRGIGVLAIASHRPGLYHGPEMEVLIKILDQANRAVNNLESIIASERSKMDSMVASMADGVIMFDKDLGLLVINPAAVKLLGLPSGSRSTIFDIARILADKVDLRAKLDESIQTDHLVSFDNLVVGGKISQLLISAVKDGKGNVLGTVVLFHDLTAQKQLERIRDDFTAMMVHELRAPLSVVRGATDSFIKDSALATTSPGRELLKTMFNSSSSMLSLVNDLLDVAKIDSGKFQIFKSPHNLSETVSDRANFFSQLAQAKTLHLSAENVVPDLHLNFDSDRVSQVLNNLLSNAIKFTSPGGKITVTAYKINSHTDIKWRFAPLSDIIMESPSALVAVSDTGLGIAADKIPELFSKFKQLHPVEQGPGGTVGTGLGLVIARGIIESHGGKMFLESKVEEGTTFYFTLPI